MRLLNVGAGFPRIKGDQWVNLDNLYNHLPPGSPERAQLDAETNYVNHDLLDGPMPFPDESFDGAICLHTLEHFDAQEALRILKDCHRILKPGASIMVSVPDAGYFRLHYHEDNRKNQVRLFGEKLDDGNPHEKMFCAALFMDEHLAILTDDAVWCYLRMAGFEPTELCYIKDEQWTEPQKHMRNQLNRRKFSCELIGIKNNSK